MNRVEVVYTILAAADVVERVRELAAKFTGGAGMFVIPVYLGDDIVHYISSGHIDERIGLMLANPEEVAGEIGEDPEEMAALKEKIIVTRERAHTVLNRLGYSLEPATTGG